MDPLSLTVSIAGLISLADLIVAKSSRLYRSARDAPKETSRLIGEVASLSGILSALNRIVDNQMAAPHDTIALISSLDAVKMVEPVILQACRQTLEQLQSIVAKLETRPGETLVNAARQMKWIFKEAEINEILTKLERYKNSFHLAIAAENMFQLQQLLENEAFFLENMKEIKIELTSEVRAIAAQQREERQDSMRKEKEFRHREVLEFLSPVKHAINHEAASKLQQVGTGRWFLDGKNFQNWLKEDNSFLWVHGIAGAGKAILASMAIDEIQNYCKVNDYRLAYFYCDFKDSNFQDPVNVIGSIIGQLAVQETELPEDLVTLFSDCSKSRTRPSLEKLLDVLKNRPLCKAHRTYIVIDALDECTNREALLNGLAELHSLIDLALSILVTSRMENDIKDAFEGLPSLFIKKNDISSDVELYVKSEIQKRKKLKEKTDFVKDRISSTLVEGAKGMTTKATLQALEDLPVGLDETYERILANISDDDFELASNTLRWVTYSIRPLEIEELVDAIAITPGQPEIDEDIRLTDPNDIFDICGNLLDQVSDNIGLAHFSVREFLTSPRLLTKSSRISRYALSKEPVHTELASICLTYLSFKSFGDGPCKNSKALRARLKKYPLLDYAARYCGTHSNLGDIKLEGEWFTELFTIQGNPKILSLLEIISFQDRKNPTRLYEGRYYDDDKESIISIVTRLGFQALAMKLVENGADVNFQGGRYGNALQLAANLGDAGLVRLLLDYGANVNAVGGYFGNALQAASTTGDLETIKLLLERGTDVNAQNGCLKTALQAASLNRHKDVVKLYLQHGADVNIIGGYHGSALRAAAMSGEFEIAKLLIEHGADVNSQDASCRSVLHGAAQYGNYEMMKMLLEHGADPDPPLSSDKTIVSRGGFSTPLVCAIFSGNQKAVNLLLEHGAAVNTTANETPLSAAAGLGKIDLIEILLEKGANIDGEPSFIGNPLAGAISGDQFEVFQLLLKHGANPNRDGGPSCSLTPLEVAVSHENDKYIRLLVENGANLNNGGIIYGGALHFAAYSRRMDIVLTLLDLGADLNSQNGQFGSPFLAAVAGGKREIVELFLRLRISTSLPDCFGFNLSHWIKYGWKSCHELNNVNCWPDVTNMETDVNLTKCKKSISAFLQAIKNSASNFFLFEVLGRSLAVYGLNDEAVTSFERGIRRIGEEGAFVHVWRCCNICETPDDIAGPRYICKICYDYDLCKQCYNNMKESHGAQYREVHDFLETPSSSWYTLPSGIVNDRGETKDQWIERLEQMFRD